MEKAFKYLLLQQAAFAALVGDRVYPIYLPQAGTYPACTYQITSAPRQYTQEGKQNLTPYGVQVDLWAETYAEVVAMKKALIGDASTQSVSGLSNVEIGSPPIFFGGVFVSNERDLGDPALEQAGPFLFRKSFDLSVWANDY